jgi:hypothetical protein
MRDGSARCRSPIPLDADHRFRGCRSPIPGMPITESGDADHQAGGTVSLTQGIGEVAAGGGTARGSGQVGAGQPAGRTSKARQPRRCPCLRRGCPCERFERYCD